MQHCRAAIFLAVLLTGWSGLAPPSGADEVTGPEPPADVEARYQERGERKVIVTWERSPDDGAGTPTQARYLVERITEDGGFDVVVRLPMGTTTWEAPTEGRWRVSVAPPVQVLRVQPREDTYLWDGMAVAVWKPIPEETHRVSEDGIFNNFLYPQDRIRYRLYRREATPEEAEGRPIEGDDGGQLIATLHRGVAKYFDGEVEQGKTYIYTIEPLIILEPELTGEKLEWERFEQDRAGRAGVAGYRVRRRPVDEGGSPAGEWQFVAHVGPGVTEFEQAIAPMMQEEQERLYQPVAVEELGRYVGRSVKVTLKEPAGQEQRAHLLAVQTVEGQEPVFTLRFQHPYLEEADPQEEAVEQGRIVSAQILGQPPEYGDWFEYAVTALGSDGAESVPVVSNPVEVNRSWLAWIKWPTLLFTAVFIGLVLFFIRSARKKELYLRPIAGIEAVEEAVGRACEMGRPMLYCAGIGQISEIGSLASLDILSNVAETAAEYSTPIQVPNFDPIVYSVADEVVQESFMRAGRPDAYNEEWVHFVSDRQFAYAAAVSGTMVREKPATNFFMGVFFAESLLLAETGAMTGAIQIAGTDQVTQLPFFITACDYTLIGEELYAAGAYMGGDPGLVGSLKGQDWAKVIVVVGILALVALVTVGIGMMGLEIDLENLREAFMGE